MSISQAKPVEGMGISRSGPSRRHRVGRAVLDPGDWITLAVTGGCGNGWELSADSIGEGFHAQPLRGEMPGQDQGDIERLRGKVFVKAHFAGEEGIGADAGGIVKVLSRSATGEGDAPHLS